MTDNEQRQKWERDETRWRWVIGLVMTVLLTTGGHLITGVWWAASINERVQGVEQRYERQRLDITTMQAATQSDRIGAARQEQKLEEALRLLRNIEARMDGPRP